MQQMHAGHLKQDKLTLNSLKEDLIASARFQSRLSW
jgi:hypothetical protein